MALSMIGTNALSVEAIRSRLTLWSRDEPMHLFEKVTSTNALLAELAKQGASDRTVVLAEEQTAGHGRLGKPWFSPPGVNLYASVLLRPEIPLRSAPVFSFVASLAVADAMKREGVVVAIRWPNDVLVNGKKVVGTLAESSSRGTRLDFLILGVGVNLNITEDALRAALGDSARAASSLRAATGREVDRNAFAASYLDGLARWIQVHATQGAAALIAAWSDRDIMTGRRVEVRGEGEPYDGRVVGVDSDGYLVVRNGRGQRRRVVAGEVRSIE
jgi:BirA family biotin operon repressor/biotin-[acetyl-CoA-carboxylase] ligase